MDWINYSAGRYGQKVDISLLKVLKVNQRIQNLQRALFVSWAHNTFKRAHPKEIPRFFPLRFHTRVMARNIGKHCLVSRKKRISKKL